MYRLFYSVRHCPLKALLPAALFLSAVPGVASDRTLPLGSGPPAHKEHKRDYKREIEALEEQWRQAQLTGDAATMDKLLAADYLGISIGGQVYDKTQQLDRMNNRELVLARLDVSEKKIKLVGPVAIVTSLAKVEGTTHGAPLNGMFRYTRIYRRYSDGTWRITNFEVTRVPNAATDQGPR